MEHRLSLFRRLTESPVIQSVRSAFIALIPYLILSSALTLLAALLGTLGYSQPLTNYISSAAAIISNLFPLMVLISLSFYLSKHRRLPAITSVFLTLCCFFALDADTIKQSLHSDRFLPFQPYALILPFIVVPLLSKLVRKLRFQFIGHRRLSRHLQENLNLLLPYLTCFILVVSLITLVNPLLAQVLKPLVNTIAEQSVFVQSILRLTAIQIFWFLGIHGDNAHNLLFNTEFLSEASLAGLDASAILDAFATMGGSGSGLALVISVLLFCKDEPSRKIAKISLPFVIFNINEILLFGLPVVFNPALIIPFILIPILQFLLAHFAIGIGWVELNGTIPAWITPSFINGYLISGDNLSGIFLQAACLILGIAIYRPFVNNLHLYNFDREMAENLASKLAVEQSFVTGQKTIKSNQVQAPSTQGNIAEDILAGELFLTYQPRLDLQEQSIDSLNVCINLRTSDNKVINENILNKIAHRPVETVVYSWLFKRLARELEDWSIKEFKPRVHIPLEQHLLASNELVGLLIRTLEPHCQQVTLDISERALADIDTNIVGNLDMLAEHNFSSALSLFSGFGESFFSLLHFPVSEVCFQEKILYIAENERGESMLKGLVSTCKSLGLHCHLCQLTEQHHREIAERCQLDSISGPELCSAMSAKATLSYVSELASQQNLKITTEQP